MKNNCLKILLLDGASNQVLPIMSSLYKSGHIVTIISSRRLCSGFFSRYAHEKILWPELFKEESATLEKLKNYLATTKTDLVLGLADKSIRFLSDNYQHLKHLTNIVLPNHATLSIATDKFKTMKFCMEHLIPCPYTIDGECIDFGNIERNFKFPVIVKPKIGVGSVGVYKYTDPNKLINDYNWLTKKYGSLIVQEYIPNEEQYTVEAFCDHKSKVKACVVVLKSRFYPVTGGTSSCNITVDRPEIESVVIRFLERLEWIGPANLDVIYDRRDNTPKIIEINPRVGSMVKIVFKAGVNIADMMINLAFNSNIRDSKDYYRGIVLRNLLLDIPWLISSSINTIKNTEPSFFQFWGHRVFYENFSKDDPFTGIGYFLDSLRKYFNLAAFKNKFQNRTI